MWPDVVNLGGGVSSILAILCVAPFQATCTDGRVVDRARAWCSMAGIPYYRFNPQMSKDVAMDETSNKVLIQILWETKAHMFQNRSMVMELAEFLCRE